MRDETIKDTCNCQTTAWISHDLIWNNELAFPSNKLAVLTQLIFKYQTTEFGIDLEASQCKLSKFTTVQVFRWRPLSYKKIWIENHLSQPTNMTLSTAHEANTGQPRFWLAHHFLLLDTLSSPVCSVWSYMYLLNIQHRFPIICH